MMNRKIGLLKKKEIETTLKFVPLLLNPIFDYVSWDYLLDNPVLLVIYLITLIVTFIFTINELQKLDKNKT